MDLRQSLDVLKLMDQDHDENSFAAEEKKQPAAKPKN